MGQIFKQILSSQWLAVALLFLATFFTFKNLKIFGPPKVKLDEATGKLVPDNSMRNAMALALGLAAAIGVPLLIGKAYSALTFVGWGVAVIVSAIIIDQAFAKFRKSAMPEIEKWWQERKTNSRRKS
jgi:hypothetical protein